MEEKGKNFDGSLLKARDRCKASEMVENLPFKPIWYNLFEELEKELN